jgi:hypothetical protein
MSKKRKPTGFKPPSGKQTDLVTSKKKFNLYGLDLRSIAFFRIVLGLNIILNLVQYRLFNISAFYSPDGIVPIEHIRNFYGENFSLLFSLENESSILIYFLLTLFLAILYTLGIKSRWLSWPLLLLFAGIVNRNPMVAHGVEFLIEISLFWGIFLPLDNNYSIAPDRRSHPNPIRGLLAKGILFQIALVYFTSFITKTGDLWTSGLAIYSLTADLTHGNFLGPLLAHSPGLCKFLTYLSLIIEFALPFLIFMPIFSRKARILASFLIVFLHFGLASTIYVGPFHFITLCFAILLLPDSVWDSLKFKKDKNFGKIKIGQWHLLDKLPANLQIAGTRIAQVFVVVMMVVIFQRNFQKWEQNSFLSGGIKNSPGLENVAKSNPLDFRFVTGVFRQPWWLFAPNPHKDMGTMIILGRTPENETIDIINNQILIVSNDPVYNVPIFDKSVQNNFRNSRFTLSFYTRKYLDKLPPELYKRWTEYEYQRWIKKHPNQPLLELSLYYYAQPTRIEKGKIIREKGLLPLHRMEI